ncbi:hypothetical protein STRIP9103_07323 [Streptomyces ipomoeae 91-03]|uniref:Uncharacterized protein n=1 Tax=Streptomyces ipomoeae 91-03 TaxID=698759 RepID=L1L5B0_9ACTN|nr:hypothetical protein STRIP9103_07323 [Streptomyces ipomoeae 91-03]
MVEAEARGVRGGIKIEFSSMGAAGGRVWLRSQVEGAGVGSRA